VTGRGRRIGEILQRQVFQRKSLAGVRSLGVGIALAGALAVFFGQSLTAAFVALTIPCGINP